MRAWVHTDRLTGLGLTTGDVIDAIQSQNVQAAVGRVGARPDLRRPATPAQHPDQGPPDLGRGIREHRHPHQPRTDRSCGSSDVARLELGAANLDRETRFNGSPAAAIAIYQTPGANAIDHA